MYGVSRLLEEEVTKLKDNASRAFGTTEENLCFEI